VLTAGIVVAITGFCVIDPTLLARMGFTTLSVSAIHIKIFITFIKYVPQVVSEPSTPKYDRFSVWQIFFARLYCGALSDTD
jgi:hypothetical protein